MASSIFNTDQGSRFTSGAFAEELKAKIIQIGIDERGREADNISVGVVWCSAGDDRADGMVCFIYNADRHSGIRIAKRPIRFARQ